MPNLLIKCSEVWWQRRNDVVNTAIDTCVGLTAQINNHTINGTYEAEDLLERIEAQLRDMRRALETIQVPF